ncbi:MAG: trypsin-like peptidase domain-containing protein [Pseudomonadota bacterium]
MSPRKILIFLSQSAAVGIIAAILLIFLLPETWLQTREVITIFTGDADNESIHDAPFSYAHAVSRATPAVVNIYTKKQIQGNRRLPANHADIAKLKDAFGKDIDHTITNLGSGVIVTPQGHILTNNHVIENAEEIEVLLRDGRQVTAHVVGADPDTDLAVLHINVTDLPVLTFTDSENLEVGDVVLAIGNPFGLGQTVSQGIISATGRNQLGVNVLENYIQTDAAINPGNSGGALINARGELIGINTITSSSNGYSVGIGFAIPINLAKKVMTDMIEFGHVQRGWIGIQVQNITPQLSESFGLSETSGVLVSGVVRDGPAHSSGLYPGDILVAINNQPIVDQRQVLNEVIIYQPNEVLDINGIREGKSEDWKVKVEQRPIYGAATY